MSIEQEATEAKYITPSERVTIAEQHLQTAQQRVEAAQRAHHEASTEYVNALRAFHQAYAVHELEPADPPSIDVPRLPARDHQQA